MLRTTITATIMLSVFAGAASADMLYTAAGPQERSSGAHGAINQRKLAAVILNERLTFLNAERDVDKDGFVDSSIVAIANPDGYVVFHFRSMQLNRRIVLGHLLGVEGMGPTTLDTGNSGDGGGAAAAEPRSPIIFGNDFEPLHVDDPALSYDPPPADPVVPEPATIAMLAMGSFALLRRK